MKQSAQSHLTPFEIKGEISKVISVGIEGKKFSKRRQHNVLLVLLFWLVMLEFKILIQISIFLLP